MPFKTILSYTFYRFRCHYPLIIRTKNFLIAFIFWFCISLQIYNLLFSDQSPFHNFFITQYRSLKISYDERTLTFTKRTFIQNNKTIRLSEVWHELLISATSETAVSQQQPKVETQQTSSSSHEEKVLDDGTVVQMSSSSARKTSSSSQEMTIPISFGQLTRQTSQAKTPRY